MIDAYNRKWALVGAALAAAYFAAGKFGLLLAFYNASASPVWPPTGLSLAALLLLGRRFWPAIFAGAFLVNISTQGTLLTCLAIAAGNASEAWLCAWAIERWAKGRACLNSSASIFIYVPIVLVGTTISATIGTVSLGAGSYAPWSEFHRVWLTWWLGDATSALIFAPAILLATQVSWRAAGAFFRIERMTAFLFLCAACMMVFAGYSHGSIKNYPLTFLCGPALLWIAFRLGQWEAALANVLLTSFAIWGTINGWGPFVGDGPNASLALLQSYLSLVSITTLAFAALTHERESAIRETCRLNLELEDRVKERSVALDRQSQALARSNAELEMFASVVSHDLQEPLRKIIAFSDLLERKSHRSLGPESSSYVSRMRSAAGRMRDMVQDLLNYSKATFKPAPRSVALDEIVQEVLSDLEVAVETVHAQIEVGKLPRVFADKTQMRQLFMNLLGNAFKFTRSPVIPKVKVELVNSDGRQAWISVSDNGMGFRQEAEDELFQPFTRLKENNRKSGTGMGLAICRKIVRRHGGTIAAISAKDQGSRFIVSLPLARRGQEAEYAQSTAV